MPDHLWYKHYPKDWVGDPELRLCSPAARGLLADIMSLCHFGKPYGYLTRRNGKKYSTAELCEILHYRPAQFRRLWKELIRRSRIVKEGSATYVPRMVKEKRKLDEFTEHGKKGGNPDLDKPRKPKKKKPRKTKKATPWEYTPEFETFWKTCPRPIGKRRAFRAWNEAIEAGIDPLVMIAAMQQYAESVADVELTYILSPVKWIEGGCWDDVPDKEQEKRRRETKRRAAAQKEYNAAMSEFVVYVKEASESGTVLGGSLDELIGRIGVDVKKQLGPKGLKDFEKRIEKFKRPQ